MEVNGFDGQHLHHVWHLCVCVCVCVYSMYIPNVFLMFLMCLTDSISTMFGTYVCVCVCVCVCVYS